MLLAFLEEIGSNQQLVFCGIEQFGRFELSTNVASISKPH